jgi:uncharacterized damage-inducible protein DinB
MSPPTTIQALCRANLGLLRQKLQLVSVLKSSFGDSKAKTLYAQVCPVVEASVGQHIRHSMDHLELAAQLAAGKSETNELHYDLRKRGGEDEHDMDEAQQRMERVVELLKDVPEATQPETVQAYFMLSGDPKEFQLPSTLEREMGFAAHHGIHHMAMVKIIALGTLGIPRDALSLDFGRAPSTIVYDRNLSSDQSTPQ